LEEKKLTSGLGGKKTVLAHWRCCFSTLRIYVTYLCMMPTHFSYAGERFANGGGFFRGGGVVRHLSGRIQASKHTQLVLLLLLLLLLLQLLDNDVLRSVGTTTFDSDSCRIIIARLYIFLPQRLVACVCGDVQRTLM